MKVSTQFPLAVHAIMMIAYFPQARITSEIVGQSAGCNAVTVRHIFIKLKQAGLLSIKTGRGGTSLAKPAEEITLWDIYLAVESDATDDIFKIHGNTSEICPVGGQLRRVLLSHLDEAVAAMKQKLSSVTLADMADEIVARNGMSTPDCKHSAPTADR